jgi:large subunit ribosomal protein L5
MIGLKEKYQDEVVPRIKEDLGITNVSRIPRVKKIVVNMGFGIVDKTELKSLLDQLTLITGQKPVVNKARKSIANFKLREGMNIGAKVTLRGDRMYEFLNRLINVALPRIRDFRGVSSTAFDGKGNYTLGLKDQLIFPEVDANNVKNNQGMDITIVTSTNKNEEAATLLTLLGMPFAKK